MKTNDIYKSVWEQRQHKLQRADESSQENKSRLPHSRDSTLWYRLPISLACLKFMTSHGNSNQIPIPSDRRYRNSWENLYRIVAVKSPGVHLEFPCSTSMLFQHLVSDGNLQGCAKELFPSRSRKVHLFPFARCWRICLRLQYLGSEPLISKWCKNHHFTDNLGFTKCYVT